MFHLLCAGNRIAGTSLNSEAQRWELLFMLMEQTLVYTFLRISLRQWNRILFFDLDMNLLSDELASSSPSISYSTTYTYRTVKPIYTMIWSSKQTIYFITDC